MCRGVYFYQTSQGMHPIGKNADMGHNFKLIRIAIGRYKQRISNQSTHWLLVSLSHGDNLLQEIAECGIWS